tara:strand:+ start:269 stop:871 length:603 start_codon:yes stop_codon:yes gene_type:complete
MELHVIRHGETNWNKEKRIQGQSESELTEQGVLQAQELGERIRELKFDAIYCSSSLRTIQTAKYIFENTEKKIHYRDSLREIFLGPWEGRLHEEVLNTDPVNHKHFTTLPHLFKIKSAETFLDLQNRAVTAITEIGQMHKNQKIAVISHGALIKAYLCYIENKPISRLWDPPQIHNCSHTIISVNKNGNGELIQLVDKKV